MSDANGSLAPPVPSDESSPKLASTPKSSALPTPSSPSKQSASSTSSTVDNTTGLGDVTMDTADSKEQAPSTATTPTSQKKKRSRLPPVFDPNDVRKSGRERKPAPIMKDTDNAQKEELADHLRYHSRMPSKKKREQAKKEAAAKRSSSGSNKKKGSKKKSDSESESEEAASDSDEPVKKRARKTPPSKKGSSGAGAAAGGEGHVCVVFHAVDDEETKFYVAPAKKVTSAHTALLSELHGAGANDESRKSDFVELLEDVFTQIAKLAYGQDADGPVQLNRRIQSLYHITFL